MKLKNIFSSFSYFLRVFGSSSEITNDPTLSLLNENQEFEVGLKDKLDYVEYIKYIYINRKYFFAILFDLEEKINISDTILDNKSNNKLFFFLFYLYLLIEENKDIVFFIYTSDLIKKVKTLIKEDNNNIFYNIVLSKIIIILINNYLVENFMNSNQKLLDIKNEMETIIRNNTANLKNIINFEYNLEIIISKNLDDIYLDIFLALLKSEKVNNYILFTNISKQLHLDAIEILNKNIFWKLNSFLNKKRFKKKFLLQKLEDFNDTFKINIYFFLLKYVFKNSLYIYQIPFFLEARKTLFKCIKSNKAEILNNKNYEKHFILERLFDLDYYINKYIGGKTFDDNNDNLSDFAQEDLMQKENNNDNSKDFEDIREVLDYYKKYEFESKKDDIELIDTSLKNNKKIDYKKYFGDLEKAKEMNPKYDIIRFYHSKKENKNKHFSESELKNSIKSYLLNEKMIKGKKLNKIQSNIIKILYEYFKNPNNKEEIKKIYKEDE